MRKIKEVCVLYAALAATPALADPTLSPWVASSSSSALTLIDDQLVDATPRTLTATTTVEGQLPWGTVNEFVEQGDYDIGAKAEKYRAAECRAEDKLETDDRADALDELTGYAFGDPIQVAIDLSQDEALTPAGSTTMAPSTGNAPNGKDFTENLTSEFIKAIIILILPLVFLILSCVWWYGCAYYCFCIRWCRCWVWERGPCFGKKKYCYPTVCLVCLAVVLISQVKSFFGGDKLEMGANLAFCGSATVVREITLGEVSTREGRFIGMIQLSLNIQTVRSKLLEGSQFQTDLQAAMNPTSELDKANVLWREHINTAMVHYKDIQADMTRYGLYQKCLGCSWLVSSLEDYKSGLGGFVGSALGFLMVRDMVQTAIMGAGGQALAVMLEGMVELFQGLMGAARAADPWLTDEAVERKDEVAKSFTPNFFGAYFALLILIVTCYVQWLQFYREVRTDTGHYRKNPLIACNWCCGCCCSWCFLLQGFLASLWVMPSASACLWMQRLSYGHLDRTANALSGKRFDFETGLVIDECLVDGGGGNLLGAMRGDGCQVPKLDEDGKATGEYNYPTDCDDQYKTRIPMDKKLGAQITETNDNAWAMIEDAENAVGDPTTMMTGKSAGLYDLVGMGAHTFIMPSIVDIALMKLDAKYSSIYSDDGGGTDITAAPTAFAVVGSQTRLNLWRAAAWVNAVCEDTDFPDRSSQSAREAGLLIAKTPLGTRYGILPDLVTKVYGWKHLYTAIKQYPYPHSAKTAEADGEATATDCSEGQVSTVMSLFCPNPTAADYEVMYLECRAYLVLNGGWHLALPAATAYVGLSAPEKTVMGLEDLTAADVADGAWPLGFGSLGMCNPCWAGKKALMDRLHVTGIATVISPTEYPEPADVSGEMELVSSQSDSGAPCYFGLGGDQTGVYTLWSSDCVEAHAPTATNPASFKVDKISANVDNGTGDSVIGDAASKFWVAGGLAHMQATTGGGSWASLADTLADHPMVGSANLCARLADSSNFFYGNAATPGMASRTPTDKMKVLMKSCFGRAYFAWGMWASTRRVEATAAVARDPLTNDVRPLIEMHVTNPIKRNLLTGMNCTPLANAKKMMFDGLCFGTLIEAGRGMADNTRIGFSFVIYGLFSWFLWRRVKDNFTVQSSREKRALQDLEFLKEMEEEGIDGIISPEEKTRIHLAVEHAAAHRANVLGSLKGGAFKGLNLVGGAALKGLGTGLRGAKAGMAVGGAVTAKVPGGAKMTSMVPGKK